MTRCFSSVAEGVRFHRRSQSGRRGETLVSKIQLRWGQHSSQLRNARLERDVFAAATSVFLLVAFAARFSLRNVASIVGAIPPAGIGPSDTIFLGEIFRKHTPPDLACPSPCSGRDEGTPGGTDAAELC